MEVTYSYLAGHYGNQSVDMVCVVVGRYVAMSMPTAICIMVGLHDVSFHSRISSPHDDGMRMRMLMRLEVPYSKTVSPPEHQSPFAQRMLPSRSTCKSATGHFQQIQTLPHFDAGIP